MRMTTRSSTGAYLAKLETGELGKCGKPSGEWPASTAALLQRGAGGSRDFGFQRKGRGIPVAVVLVAVVVLVV